MDWEVHDHLIGSPRIFFDHLLRALTRIESPTTHSFLAMIDTGFNRELLMSRSMALDLGLKVSDPHQSNDTAVRAGGRVPLSYAKTTIHWLGEQRGVLVLVIADDATIKYDGSDVALLGAQLLLDCQVVFDYASGSVTIQRTGQ